MDECGREHAKGTFYFCIPHGPSCTSLCSYACFYASLCVGKKMPLKEPDAADLPNLHTYFVECKLHRVTDSDADLANSKTTPPDCAGKTAQKEA